MNIYVKQASISSEEILCSATMEYVLRRALGEKPIGLRTIGTSSYFVFAPGGVHYQEIAQKVRTEKVSLESLMCWDREARALLALSQMASIGPITPPTILSGERFLATTDMHLTLFLGAMGIHPDRVTWAVIPVFSPRLDIFFLFKIATENDFTEVLQCWLKKIFDSTDESTTVNLGDYMDHKVAWDRVRKEKVIHGNQNGR